jgi:hypothetical protein
MTWSIQKLTLAVLTPLIMVLGISAFSCSDNPTVQAKTSSLLLLQVSLRKEQLTTPTQERLAQMRAQGMNVSNIGIQRIYIYLNQQLTPAHDSELRSMGITLYPNSWIPPAVNHPTGFMLADMPVDQMNALAAKDYVVRLDTAEVQSQPQQDMLPETSK